MISKKEKKKSPELRWKSMKTIGERHLENFLPIVSCTVNARGKLMP